MCYIICVSCTSLVFENKHRNVVELIMVIKQELVGMYTYYRINRMLEKLYDLYYPTGYVIISVLTRKVIERKHINK